MPKSKKTKNREPKPDPIYNSQMVTRLVNASMKSGKKKVVERHIYAALEQIAGKDKLKDPIVILEAAIENVGPTKKVRPRRVGGASYLVPVSVSARQRLSLAIRWIVGAANSRSNPESRTYKAKLVAELLDAADNKGGAVEKKENMHKVAEANKAFAHFRW